MMFVGDTECCGRWGQEGGCSAALVPVPPYSCPESHGVGRSARVGLRAGRSRAAHHRHRHVHRRRRRGGGLHGERADDHGRCARVALFALPLISSCKTDTPPSCRGGAPRRSAQHRAADRRRRDLRREPLLRQGPHPGTPHWTLVLSPLSFPHRNLRRPLGTDWRLQGRF